MSARRWRVSTMATSWQITLFYVTFSGKGPRFLGCLPMRDTSIGLLVLVHNCVDFPETLTWLSSEEKTKRRLTLLHVLILTRMASSENSSAWWVRHLFALVGHLQSKRRRCGCAYFNCLREPRTVTDPLLKCDARNDSTLGLSG